jgi:O-antigen/teichoic acid export membrane protein
MWKFLERGGVQGLQFVISIILARLLLPEDYGILALVVIFITIANVFIQSGLNTALIQKKTVDQVDYSSVFFLSLGIATSLYVLLYFVAPFIARFYDNQSLVSVLRVLALTLFPGAFNSIQNAIVSRTMQFKRLFYSSIGAGIISGVVGISLAYLGFSISTVNQPSMYYLNTLVYCKMETDSPVFFRAGKSTFFLWLETSRLFLDRYDLSRFKKPYHW